MKQNIFNSFVTYTIRIIFGIIVFGLCLQSMYSTSFIGMITKEDGSLQQRTLNIADSPIKHIIFFALFILVLMGAQKGFGKLRETDKWKCLAAWFETRMVDGRGMKLAAVLVGAAGCLWILATQLPAGSDPAKIYALAMQWRENDFSGYAEGGYLFRYPYQAGIVLFYYFLTFLFGVDNFIALQLVNVAALLVVYYLLAKLAAFYWQEDRKIQTFVYCGLALWMPLFFYVTYLYGILLGMASSLAAVFFAVKYLETRKCRYMIGAALCIGIATVFKMNCLIYLVAIACFLVYDIIVTPGWKKKMQSLCFILLMIVGVEVCNQAVYSYVENLSGYETPEGEVMVSWIVMGLQETPLGPGHYSGYIGDVFVKYDYDTEKITEASLADIKKIMTRMSENPLDEGIPFFARKNAFQWNDPTFIGMLLNENRNSIIQMPQWAQSLIAGEGSVALSVWLNLVQTWILFGALCYVILHWRSKNIYELFGAVIFIGGYIFHFFWESSSSYTIPYFVIIIPYAVKGVLDLARSCNNALAQSCNNALTQERDKSVEWMEKSRKIFNRSTIRNVALIFLGLLLLLAFRRTNLFVNTIALDDGEEARAQFYHQGQWGEEAAESTLSNGYYYVSPYLANDRGLAEQDGSIIAEEKAKKIAFARKENQWKLRFRDSELVLAVMPGNLQENLPENLRENLPEVTQSLTAYMDDSMNMFYDASQYAKAHWTAVPAGENCYYFVIDNLALSYDADTGAVLLQEYTQTEKQMWVVQEAE